MFGVVMDALATLSFFLGLALFLHGAYLVSEEQMLAGAAFILTGLIGGAWFVRFFSVLGGAT